MDEVIRTRIDAWTRTYARTDQLFVRKSISNIVSKMSFSCFQISNHDAATRAYEPQIPVPPAPPSRAYEPQLPAHSAPAMAHMHQRSAPTASAAEAYYVQSPPAPPVPATGYYVAQPPPPPVLGTTAYYTTTTTTYYIPQPPAPTSLATGAYYVPQPPPAPTASAAGAYYVPQPQAPTFPATGANYVQPLPAPTSSATEAYYVPQSPAPKASAVDYDDDGDSPLSWPSSPANPASNVNDYDYDNTSIPAQSPVTLDSDEEDDYADAAMRAHLALMSDHDDIAEEFDRDNETPPRDSSNMLRPHEPLPEAIWKPSLAEMLTFLDSWGRAHGVSYCQMRWSRNAAGQRTKCLMKCARAGQRDNLPRRGRARLGASSQKGGCPFAFYIVASDARDPKSSWRIMHMRGHRYNQRSLLHDHAPDGHISSVPGHRVWRRTEVDRRIVELYEQHILETIRSEFPGISITVQDLRDIWAEHIGA